MAGIGTKNDYQHRHTTRMRKVFKWTGIAALTPVLLFFILAVLLYLPPIQNWAAQKVAGIVSKNTGMEVSVGHVRLEWPLNLGIEDFKAIKQNDSLPQIKDTIADVGRVVADVRLWPLLKKQVVINQLSLHQAKINTNGFISDVRIKGSLEELWLSSKGIDLGKETVEVNGARLTDALLDIALSDTAAADTTESKVKWLINADSLSLNKTALTLHLPGDTLNVAAYFGKAVARDATIDLYQGIYQTSGLDWHNGTLNYDNRWEHPIKGFDYNHIDLKDIHLAADTIRYSPQGLQLAFKHCAMKEKCGIEINELSGALRLDSTYSNIQLPALTMRTPDSDIYTELDMDFSTFDDKNPGQTKARLNAQLGKQDIIKFLGEMPQTFVRSYPNQPLSIKGSVNGNMQQMEFTGLDISLPGALHANVDGTANNLMTLDKLKADIKLNAKAQDINFVLAMADAQLFKNYRIPSGITLNGTFKADGTRYTTDLTANEGSGSVRLKGSTLIPLNAKGEMVTDLMTYDADVKISHLNLHHFMPKDSLYAVSADIKAQGYGLDILSKRSHLTAEAVVHRLQYGHFNLQNLSATANLQDGHAQTSITGHNELLEGTISLDALLEKNQLDGTIDADVAKADLFRMRLVSDTLAIGFGGKIKVESDFAKSHKLSGKLDNIFIQDEKKTFHPDPIGLLLRTTSDTTYIRAQSGDFIVKVDGSGHYEHLLSQMTALTDTIIANYKENVIDQQALKRMLPTARVHLESKRNNPIATLMRTSNIDFKELLLNVDMSPETGINGAGYIYSLNYDSTRIDTIRLNLTQKGERLTYQAQVRNNKRNPQFVFNALLDGHLHEHGLLAGLRFYDNQNKLGVRIGATAEMETEGLRLRLMPERPTIGYKEFNLNKDNFIFLDRNSKVLAKVDLIADDRTGLKLYTENQDSTMLQDLTLSLNRINLGDVTSVLPYMPRITGYLDGDFHILQDQGKKISVASDMAIQNMTYENSPVGNLSTEIVYLQKEGDSHAVEARLMLDDEEFGLLSGNYHNGEEGQIDAVFKMTRLPLSLVNGFVPDQIVGLEGFGEGSLDIKGTIRHPQIDGEMYVEDAFLVSQPYSVRMRFDNDPVRIVGSHLLLENFGLYANNDEPLTLMGDIDFSDTERIMMDMRMRARNLLLINSKQEAKSITFGKAFVDVYARMQGPLDMLNIRGRLNVLGSTDMTYLLLDSPLSADNRLDELVKFTDFTDTTQTIVTRPMPEGMKMDLTINVSEGAHVVCLLDAQKNNYVDLTGGGDLRMKYNNEGINLTGRYTLNNGEMKYSLPVIPLKTFTIKDGSYVEFTGNPTNPKLNITATEQTRATITPLEGTSRSVLFECGVVITKTLQDMGLEFIIESPEDNSINGELTTMSPEERSKVAVTMLTTGMYLAGGDTNGFSMNTALNSFLQSEINNITGSALRTLDLSVGIDNTTDAAGTTYTDYSFKFAKRFFNNRLKIELGGKVSSGTNETMGQTQSFFDNVTMEYRLNQNATQNVKIYYKQNVYDWLEGYTGKYGAGFVWRRKLQNFLDIFAFWKKEPQPAMRPMPTMQRDSVRRDTTTMTR